jgi:hypothetical protein
MANYVAKLVRCPADVTRLSRQWSNRETKVLSY